MFLYDLSLWDQGLGFRVLGLGFRVLIFLYDLSLWDQGFTA
jgi:hypothetical protein